MGGPVRNSCCTLQRPRDLAGIVDRRALEQGGAAEIAGVLEGVA